MLFNIAMLFLVRLYRLSANEVLLSLFSRSAVKPGRSYCTAESRVLDPDYVNS